MLQRFYERKRIYHQGGVYDKEDEFSILIHPCAYVLFVFLCVFLCPDIGCVHRPSSANVFF